jgi:hypothetical protein
MKELIKIWSTEEFKFNTRGEGRRLMQLQPTVYP